MRISVLIALACLSFGADRAEQGYEVHDMSRPQPAVVVPGTFSTQESPGKPPADAVVLFDGKDLSQWQSSKGGDAPWTVEDRQIVCVPKAGSIQSKREFGDLQLHAEWMEPEGTKGTGQGRGNSGIFVMGLYELQVLDSSNAQTYPDGMAGAVYGQYPPLVNAARPQGQWQVYDAVFHSPKLDNGKVVKPATLTLFLNGILVQDHVELLGPTIHNELANYPPTHPSKGPVMLQDHGNPVHFRNLWVRELSQDVPAPPIRPAGKH